VIGPITSEDFACLEIDFSTDVKIWRGKVMARRKLTTTKTTTTTTAKPIHTLPFATMATTLVEELDLQPEASCSRIRLRMRSLPLISVCTFGTCKKLAGSSIFQTISTETVRVLDALAKIVQSHRRCGEGKRVAASQR
jgi:hypothetical protein